MSLEYYQNFGNPSYTIKSQEIRQILDSLVRNDKGSTIADLHTKRYYRNGGAFLWIDRHGIDARPDTLLSYLRKVNEMGFSLSKFYVQQIAQDLGKIRSLNLDGGKNDANHVLARLEYRLTRSYMRYAAGQRYGFTNPTYILNRLDSLESTPHDTLMRPTRYICLFDIMMEHPDEKFYQMALLTIRTGKLDGFLRGIQPKSAFYALLMQRLQKSGLTHAMRVKILCNMERCRWRQLDGPGKHNKYVLVNIPSYHLLAIDKDDTLSMRIGCGATKTKTPLLNSYIKRMDLNPQWYMPRSIIKKDMVRHAGNSHYFASRNYFIQERSTGQEINPAMVSRSMLLSGQYAVVQRGGKGNALGRIIFRFDNNFSVYLHDTSSKGVFGKEDRSVSHGCVRVEKPFELAKFLLDEKDEELIQKIKYSMTADSLAIRKLVIGSVKVTPFVPLFITYYTLYPMAGERIVEYPDVYGYDEAIFQSLKKYL